MGNKPKTKMYTATLMKKEPEQTTDNFPNQQECYLLNQIYEKLTIQEETRKTKERLNGIDESLRIIKKMLFYFCVIAIVMLLVLLVLLVCMMFLFLRENELNTRIGKIEKSVKEGTLIANMLCINKCMHYTIKEKEGFNFLKECFSCCENKAKEVKTMGTEQKNETDNKNLPTSVVQKIFNFVNIFHSIDNQNKKNKFRGI